MLRCELCDEKLYRDDARFHDCSPEWVCVIRHDDGEYIVIVNAQTPEKAATNAARRWDEDIEAGDAHVVNGGTVKVKVARKNAGPDGDREIVGRYRVEGEMRPYFWPTLMDG